MPDIFLYSGEASPNDIKLSDPTALRGGSTIISAVGLSECISTVQATSQAVFEGVAQSAGVSTVQATSEAINGVSGSSVGVSVVQGTGVSVSSSAGQSLGEAVASAVGQSVLPSAGSVICEGVALGQSQSVFSAKGEAAGESIVNAVGADGAIASIVVEAVGSSDGIAIVSGVSEAISSIAETLPHINLWSDQGIDEIERLRVEQRRKAREAQEAIEQAERIMQEAGRGSVPVTIARATVSLEKVKQLSGFDEIDDDILIMMMANRR